MAPAMRRGGDVDWSALPAPRQGLRCVIVVPARNEAVLLPRALEALVAQCNVSFAYEVIVLANNCSDATAESARRVARAARGCAIHVVEVAWPIEIANVGRARRALMDVASHRLELHAEHRGFIISTDADTRVCSDWLAATAAAIDAGVDSVGGRIVAEVDDALPPSTQQLMQLDDTYRTWRARLEGLIDPDPADPWPRHYQHFGASLAVTAQAYRAVGGQPLVPFLEDEALVRALRLADKSVRHCPRVRVHTSARLDGRAEVGLSWQLREWANHPAEGGGPPVLDPRAEARHWALRRRLRLLWRERSCGRQRLKAGEADNLAALADMLGIDGEWLGARLAKAESFGRLWEEVEARRDQVGAAAPAASPTVPMHDAVHQLRRLVGLQPGTPSV